MHPDVTWGDGLGYLESAESGFDPATNANSHFLYLLFCRMLILGLPWFSAAKVMGLVSVFWALVVLLMAYLTVKTWRNEISGLFSLHILAAAFTFWRHACIIEVYTMELAFWCLCSWCLLKYLRENHSMYFGAMIFFHATGLLVHVHMLLFFPVFLYLFRYKKNLPLAPFAFYLLPVLVVLYSVYILKANTLEQVFLDSAGDKMADIRLIELAKGLLIVPALLVFAMPLAWMLAFVFRKEAAAQYPLLAGDPFVLAQVPVALLVTGFSLLYAGPGIHVFLLPLMLYLSWIFASVFAAVFPRPGWTAAFSAAHVLLVFGFYLVYSQGFYRRNPLTEMKGGPGYLILPWANGNASSVLETSARYPIEQIPPEIQWNAEQAKKYLARQRPAR